MSDISTQAPSFTATRRAGQMASAPATLGERLARPNAEMLSYVWEAAAERRAAPVSIYRNLFKRAIDIIFIIMTLPFSLPIILFCAVALWWEGGNPFYTQKRIGLGGKHFSILKLRTMVRDADTFLEKHLEANPDAREEWDRFQKLNDDPRITPVGKALRASSIDELPQLFNVLIGDMSIVGPRPMMPNQLHMYGDPAAYNSLRPGITGLWQVSARNEEEFSHRNKVDGIYEDTLTAFGDVKILLRTVGVVLRRTGQ